MRFALLALLLTSARLDAQPKLDAFGEPLPDGAVARLGDLHRAGGLFPYHVEFTPDGKRIVASMMSGIRVWDVQTGKLQRKHEFKYPPGTVVRLADNGFHVLTHPEYVKIRIVDPAGAQKTPGAGEWIDVSDNWAISQDGKLLAAGIDSHLQLVSAHGKTKVLGRLPDDVSARMRLAFSADSSLLAVMSGSRLSVWNVAQVKEQAALALILPNLRKFLSPLAMQIAFSPDSTRLATRSMTGDVHLWQRAGPFIKAVARWPARAELGICRFQFSSDGKELFIYRSGFGFTWYDAVTGKELRIQRIDAPNAEDFYFSFETFTRGGGAVVEWYRSEARVWDARTGKKVSHLERLLEDFAPAAWLDAERVVCVQHQQVEIWNVKTGILEKTLPLPGRKVDMLAPNGSIATVVFQDNSRAAVDTVDGKILWKTPKQSDSPVAWNSNDSKTLIAQEAGHIRILDLRTGKELKRIVIEELTPHGLRHIFGSPDSRLLACSTPLDTVLIVERSTGQVRLQWNGIQNNEVAFSGDGSKFANLGDRRLEVHALDNSAPRVFEGEKWQGAVLSRDGSLLAAANLSGNILVWDLRKETPVLVKEFEATRGANRIRSLQFSPDDKRLLSVHADGIAVVWDVAEWTRTPAKPEAESGFELAWQLLADRDAGRAGGAINDLLRYRGAALALLEKQLAPVPDPHMAKAWPNLFAELDHAEFAHRSAAAKTLHKLGEAAEIAIRQRLTQPLPLESTRRLQALLVKFEESAAEERIRLARAVEVLERIGSPRARQLLKRLADGLPGAFLTREAEEALARLPK